MPNQVLQSSGGLLGPMPEVMPQKNYGFRPDKTKKGKGWLGEIKIPNGVATEYSTQSGAVQLNGKKIDFPTLVPTLSPEEVRLMAEDIIPNKKPIPEEIMQKAIKHANMRIKYGKSPFFD